MAEYVGNPAHALARTQCPGRPRVSRALQAKRADTGRMSAPSQSFPDAREVLVVPRAVTRLGAEHVLGNGGQPRAMRSRCRAAGRSTNSAVSVSVIGIARPRPLFGVVSWRMVIAHRIEMERRSKSTSDHFKPQCQVVWPNPWFRQLVSAWRSRWMSPSGIEGNLSYVYNDVRYEEPERASSPDPREAPAPRRGAARERRRALAALRQAELPLRRGRGASRHLPDRHARQGSHRADFAPCRADPGRRARRGLLPRLVGGDREAVRDQPGADPAATAAAVCAAEAISTPIPRPRRP